MKRKYEVIENKKRFFGAELAADEITVTTPAHKMRDDITLIPGDTYRIGPYILTCITASAKTITGRIETAQ